MNDLLRSMDESGILSYATDTVFKISTKNNWSDTQVHMNNLKLTKLSIWELFLTLIRSDVSIDKTKLSEIIGTSSLMAIFYVLF